MYGTDLTAVGKLEGTPTVARVNADADTAFLLDINNGAIQAGIRDTDGNVLSMLVLAL